MDHAVLVHVLTQKGKGYLPAEKNPSRFHGVEPFDIETGKSKTIKEHPSYTDIFSRKLCQLAQERKDIVAVTAAMPDGTGLKKFAKLYPERFFDVGIAEQHGVTSAAGMAAAGLKPVVAVYSSFLQRGYDQILHDVCIQNLPVVFAIDRAGLVGSDGETHQGIFDLSYMTSIPNMSVMAPKNLWELRRELEFAMDYHGPIAIRYPRGEAYRGLKEFNDPIVYGKGEMLYEESQIALLAVGSMVKIAEEVSAGLKEHGYDCTLVNVRFVQPMDQELLEELPNGHGLLVTMEENVRKGGFGEHVASYYENRRLREIASQAWGADIEEKQQYQPQILNISVPDEYVEHGNVDVLRKELGIDGKSVTDKILTVMKEMKNGRQKSL